MTGLQFLKNYFVLLVDSIYNRMQTQKCHQKVSSKVSSKGVYKLKSVFKRCLLKVYKNSKSVFKISDSF